MLLKASRFLLAVGSIILLQACGGGGRPTEASGTITSTAASSFVSGQQDTLQKSANSFDADAVKNSFVSTSTRRNQMEYLSAALGRTLSGPERDLGGCTPTASGDQTDGDSDSLPVSASYSFAGCTPTLGSLSGSFGLADADDTKALPLAGFRLTIDNFGFSLSAGRESVNLTVNGFFNVGVSTTAITNGIEMVYDLSAGSASTNLGIYIDTTLTPTSMGSPAAGGSIAYSGFFKMAAGENDFVLAFSSTDLTYEYPCNGGPADEDKVIKNGTLTIKDGSNNTITGTFTNCTPVWKYNDETLTITR